MPIYEYEPIDGGARIPQLFHAWKEAPEQMEIGGVRCRKVIASSIAFAWPNGQRPAHDDIRRENQHLFDTDRSHPSGLTAAERVRKGMAVTDGCAREI